MLSIDFIIEGPLKLLWCFDAPLEYILLFVLSCFFKSRHVKAWSNKCASLAGKKAWFGISHACIKDVHWAIWVHDNLTGNLFVIFSNTIVVSSCITICFGWTYFTYTFISLTTFLFLDVLLADLARKRPTHYRLIRMDAWVEWIVVFERVYPV